MGAKVDMPRPTLPFSVPFIPGLLNSDQIHFEQARDRCVRVDTPDEFGTGFIAETGLVICNKHYLKRASKVFVDGTRARIICKSQNNDLAALHVPTGIFAPIKIVDKVAMNEKVFYFGNTYELEKTRYVGEITHVEKKRLGASCSTEPGTCGASLWNSVGVLGVLCTYDGQVTALALRGTILRRFISFARKKMREALTPAQVSAPFQLKLM